MPIKVRLYNATVPAPIGPRLIHIVGANTLGNGLWSKNLFTQTANNARYMKKPEPQETILKNTPKLNSSPFRFDKIIPPPMGITINPTGGMKKDGLICSKCKASDLKRL